MSGEMNQSLSENSLDVEIPVQYTDEVIVELSTVQGVTTLIGEDNVSVAFQINNPSSDTNLTYTITPFSDTNLSNFYKLDGTDGNSGTLSSENSFEHKVQIPNSFEKGIEYRYRITLQSSRGDKVTQNFTILVDENSVTPNISVTTPPETEDIYITINDTNITLEASFSSQMTPRIVDTNWSLVNGTFQIENNSSNPATIIGFEGNISDTVVLRISDINGLVTVETYVLNINDTTPPEAPTVNSPAITNLSPVRVTVSGEPSATVVVNGVSTASKISSSGETEVDITLPNEGENNISIALKDGNGNIGDEVNISIELDTTPPNSDATVTFIETDSLSPELNGTLPTAVGDDNVSKYSVSVTVNSETFDATVYGDKWGVSASTFGDMSEGYYDVNITVKDDVNNSATSSVENGFRINYSAYVTTPQIEGLTYSCGSKSGKLGSSGLFKYERGANLTLYLGNSSSGLTLGTLSIDSYLVENSGQKEIDFLKLLNGSDTRESQKSLNLIRLLTSLDADKDISNGITIDNGTEEAFILANPSFSLDSNSSTFESESEISDIFNDLAVHFGEHRGLISESDGEAILTSLINGTAVQQPVTASSVPEEVLTLQGVLQSAEGPVEGIAFRSGSQSGFTDGSGTFSYEDGKKVRFSIGMMELSETDGKATMTPYDMVESVSFDHPKPRNIASLLTLFDATSGDSKVTIDQAVIDAVDKYRSPIDLNLPDGVANDELGIPAGENEFMAQFSGFEIGAEMLEEINSSRESSRGLTK